MTNKCVPMIHVRDVRATADWYEEIGFRVLTTYGDGEGGLSFAMLAFGTGEVMFSSGGWTSPRHRREVDLYVYTEEVDVLHETLKARVEIVSEPHDMFYGMRELIVRDLNGFWIAFGEPSPGERLMDAVRRGDADGVRAALEGHGLTAPRLSAALGVASQATPERGPAIERLLRQAGAIAAPPASV